ncbi:MAG: complex I NDUFA9 subunit family protein [Pseudomonadota bacterium]
MPLAVLIGGSGFIGRYAAQAFARADWRVRVAVRRPNEAIDVRTYGAVGQVEPVQANIRDDASIARAVAGADVVVNLVGVLAEIGAQSFDAVQAEGAERVARLAKAAGVPRYVHISAIGADADAASDYARTKAEGEAGVRRHYPDAVILRPSIVFGAEDQFFNRFAGMARVSPFLPVVGAATRFQPVYVGDVAQAVLAAATRDDAQGRTFELGGPRAYTFSELMRLMLGAIHRKRILLPLPFWLARIQAWFLDFIPWVTFGLMPNGLLTGDQVKLLAKDNVVADGAPGLGDLGVEPTTVEAVIPSYLWRFRPQGQYDEKPTGPV